MLPVNEFDYTMMSTFLRCRRRYYYRMVRHLTGKTEALAPLFGKWIHKALDIWFKEHDIDKAIQVFKNNYVGNDLDNKRTIPMGEKILKLYAEKYEHEGFKVLATEKQFSLPLPVAPQTNLIGRIDKIIEWDGAVLVLDHKTTSRLGYEFFYKIKPNMQFDGYIWAARQLGYPICNGILLDAILVAKGLLVPAQMAKLTPLARDVSYRTEEDLQAYLNNVKCIISDMQKCYTEDVWCQNTESCCDFVECPYRRICKEDESVRERIIEMDFKVDKWNPLDVE